MIKIYIKGDTHVWIPVAAETKKNSARAFLPFNGLNETYLYGYKANISKSKFLDALSHIQRAYIENEHQIFPVNGGLKEEKQYKAKWRHGRQKNSPLLGPTKGWVKVDLNVICEVNEVALGHALDLSDGVYGQLDTSIRPVLCNTNAELLEQVEKLKNTMAGGVPEGQKKPKKSTSSQDDFVRDAAVVAYILKKANGLCECCEKKAPFIKTNGDPYLEVHHVKHLAKGGSDTVSNAISICPNCHREIHFGANNTQLVENLYLKVGRLIFE